MLVLSRKRDERIVIVEIRGDKVRIGIDAPQDIPVHRHEVYEALQRQQKQSEKTAETERKAETNKPAENPSP
jgi:carbon storage regulator